MMRWVIRLGLSLAISVGLVMALVVSLVRPDLDLEPLIERYTNEQSQWVDVGGFSIHVRDQGNPEGLPVLLLHGTFASLHTWEGWVAELGDQYRIISLDLPGFGLTGPHPNHDYSLASTLNILESIREHFDINEWVVAGNSLGAGYALAYAQHKPQSVIALGLLNGGRVRLSQADYEAQQATVEARQAQERGDSIVAQALRQPLARALLAQITPAFLVRYALKDVYGHPELVGEAQVARYQDLLRRPGNREAFIKRFDRTRRLTSNVPALGDPVPAYDLNLPILIVWGDQDSWIPLDVGQTLASVLPNAELKVYAGLGHIPMEESPEETAAYFGQFLDSINPLAIESADGAQ